MSDRDWDAHFMRKAELNADMSTCMSRHVGAVAVAGRRQVADGFNGNLPGAVHCDDGGCERCKNRAFSGGDLERCVCVHAEQNIVAWCARVGHSLDNTTIYSTTHPCSDCLKLLVSAGVTHIVYRDEYPEAQQTLSAFGAIPVVIRKWQP